MKNYYKLKIDQLAVMIFWILLFAFLTSNTLKAQKEYIQPGQSYDGKMYMKTNQFVIGKRIELVNDTILRYYSASEQENYVSTKDVHWVSIKTGSKAGTGALLGGISGVLTVLLVQMNYEVDSYGGEVDWAPMYLGFGAGGLLIGALIGSASKNSKSLYMPSYRVSNNFSIGPSIKYHYPSFQLVYKL